MRTAFPDWETRLAHIKETADGSCNVGTQWRIGVMKASLGAVDPYPAVELAKASEQAKTTPCVLPVEVGRFEFSEDGTQIAQVSYDGALDDAAPGSSDATPWVVDRWDKKEDNTDVGFGMLFEWLGVSFWTKGEKAMKLMEPFKPPSGDNETKLAAFAEAVRADMLRHGQWYGLQATASGDALTATLKVTASMESGALEGFTLVYTHSCATVLPTIDKKGERTATLATPFEAPPGNMAAQRAAFAAAVRDDPQVQGISHQMVTSASGDSETTTLVARVTLTSGADAGLTLVYTETCSSTAEEVESQGEKQMELTAPFVPDPEADLPATVQAFGAHVAADPSVHGQGFRMKGGAEQDGEALTLTAALTMTSGEHAGYTLLFTQKAGPAVGDEPSSQPYTIAAGEASQADEHSQAAEPPKSAAAAAPGTEPSLSNSSNQKTLTMDYQQARPAKTIQGTPRLVCTPREASTRQVHV